MTFSENLQFLRKKANLSQENLAEKLHITRQAVSKWESAQSVPDAETCVKICEILNVTPNQLLLGEESSNLAITENKSNKKFDFMSIVLFLISVLICGTVLLACNMYNGKIFEPIIHTLSFYMIICSIAAFICVAIIRTARNRKNIL